MEMEKLLHLGKEFGLEGAKLLEFVDKQQKLEQERRREGEKKKKNVDNWRKKKKENVNN